MKELVGDVRSYAKLYPHLIGLKSWLRVFVAGVALSVVVNYYMAFSGFTDTTQYTAQIMSIYPSLTTFITVRSVAQLVIAIVGTVLLIMIIRRSRRVIRFAIAYYAGILLYAVAAVIAGFVLFNGSTVVLGAAFQGDTPLRPIFYASIWLAYFMSSRRARATFSGNSLVQDIPISSDGINGSSDIPDESSAHIKVLEKQLDVLEKIAFDLDKGCRDGQVSKEAMSKADQYVATVAEGIIDSKTVGPESYIVYEVQALIAWIKHEEDSSRKLAQVAAETKGDDVLFTQTANMILRS